MKNLGLITEYNPFHNGHLYHINQSKKITNSDNVIVVTSGNYVQRGMPAITHKYLRTKMALENGADMVLELPVYFATASAEFFSQSAINILDKTNIVDNFCFGSEIGNIAPLKNIATALSSQEYEKKLKSLVNAGLSFPVAREKALNTISPSLSEIISKPNNILGIEYLKALRKINSKITPYTIPRQTSDYHSTEIENNMPSATAIRTALYQKDFQLIETGIPHNSFHILQKEINTFGFCEPNNFSPLLHFLFSTKNKEYFKNILDISEGLENRILDIAKEHFLYTDIIKESKTKRYTYTRIQRAILHMLLDIKKDDFQTFYQDLPYIRVLGFRKEKSFLLSSLLASAQIPVVTNLKNYKNILPENGIKMLEKEIASSDIFFNAYTKKRQPHSGIEFKFPMVII